MQSSVIRLSIVLAGAFVLSALLTLIVRVLARKFGYVANPKTDRWHKKPTAVMGGVAIFATVVIGALTIVPGIPQIRIVLAASGLLFAVGLIDDLLHIKPYQKLIGQVMGASLLIFYGMSLPWTSLSTLNIVITIFWLVGITNAVNLLDNMDGLAAGIATIAAIVVAFSFSVNGQFSEVLLLTVFVGALLGFLVFNFNPASIFMGDSGSMFVGFFLACTVLLNASGGRSRSLFSVLAVPVLILFVPIFDTTFVTILRKLQGRAASQGGRDHTSHRLVALGLTERSAVLMLYCFAVLSGALALVVGELKIDQSLAAILVFVTLLTLLGVYLGRVQVYALDEENKAASNKALVAFLVDLSYKRRVFEVILDVILIMLSYYGAYALLFGAMRDTEDWRLFLRTAPVIVCLKLVSLLWSGVYRGIWRYTGIGDLIVFARAVVIGSVASVLVILLMFRFRGFSRAVFLVDGLILLVAVTSSRMAFRLLRQMLPVKQTRDGRRALIYGAGDGGELLLRELRNNPALELVPVGFVDDDPLKKGTVINGLRVFGGNGSLPQICREHTVQEVLISSIGISRERTEEIKAQCRELNIVLKRMYIQIEVLEEGMD